MTVFHFRYGGWETPLLSATNYHTAKIRAFNALILSPEDIKHGLLLRSNGKRLTEVGVLFRDWRYLALNGDSYSDFLEHPERFEDRIADEYPRFLRRVIVTVENSKELAFDASVFLRETSDELYRRRFGVEPPEPRDTWCRMSRGRYRESAIRTNGSCPVRCYAFPAKGVAE